MNHCIDLPNLTSLSIGDGSFENSTIFQLSNLDSFRSLNLGNEMFNLVSTFKIDGLTSLTSLSIGSNSFTSVKNGFGNEYSFSDYGGEFELSNLPELQSLVIGNINSNSYNFYSTPFDINSMIYINDLYNRFTLINNIINW